MYHPKPYKIKARQAWRIARQYRHLSDALNLLAKKRGLVSETHKVVAMIEVKRLYESVGFGRTHCIERAMLANLHHYLKGL